LKGDEAQKNKSVELTTNNAANILSIIDGIDEAADVFPSDGSCTQKTCYNIKTCFVKSPWFSTIAIIMFIVTFILMSLGVFGVHDKLGTYNFKTSGILNWAVLIYCLVINLLVWIMAFSGSAYCFGRKLSKWGCNLCCLKYFECLLFLAALASFVFVGLSTLSAISNGNTISSLELVCDMGDTTITKFTEAAAEDNILNTFMTIFKVETSNAKAFCADIKTVRLETGSWYASSFFAICSQFVLCIAAYRSYLLTNAVYLSVATGELDLDKTLEKTDKIRASAKKAREENKKNKRRAKYAASDSEDDAPKIMTGAAKRRAAREKAREKTRASRNKNKSDDDLQKSTDTSIEIQQTPADSASWGDWGAKKDSRGKKDIESDSEEPNKKSEAANEFGAW